MNPLPGSYNPKRDIEIIERISDGQTLKSVGERFGITRQRVHQLYCKYMGKGATARIEKAKLKREKTLDKVRYVCLLCHRNVTLREGRSRTTICKTCAPRTNGRITIPMNCTGCGVAYYPTMRSILFHATDSRYVSNRHFHSLKCWGNFTKGKRWGRA